MDAATAPVAERRVRELAFTFEGRAGEYFRIWIVNVCLTVLTLGIYSAWAKVRTRRYFYRSTRLDGHGFDYHARPITILKGRIIALVVLVGISTLYHFRPLIGAGAFAVLFLISPWIFNLAARFNARMTTYRNVPFGFAGSYGRAFVALCLWPIFAAVSFLTLLPLAARQRDAYALNNYRYGGTAFSGKPSVEAYYDAYLAGFGIFAIVFMGMFTAVVAVVVAKFGGRATPEMQTMAQVLGVAVGYVAMVAVLFFIRPFVAAKTRNAAFNSLRLGEHRFRSTLSGWGFAWLVLTNLLATAATVGLLYPWAQIRAARYVASRLTLEAASDLSEFVASAVPEGSVTASEFAVLEGLAVGLGT